MSIVHLTPQFVRGGPPPNNKIFAFQSQVDSCSQRAFASTPIYLGLQNVYTNNIRTLSSALSQSRTQFQQQQPQQLPLWTMDDKSVFGPLADRGDESYMVEGSAFNDCFSGIGLEAPNTRTQTTSAYVSAANVGRDLSPNHFQQQNKEPAGNDPMFWPSIPTASNAYAHCLGSASIEPRSHYAPWQGYESSGVDRFGSHLSFHDGLAGNSWDPNNMSVLGEPFEDQVSPTSTYRSFSSSTASDAMGSLSLDSMNRREGALDGSRMGNPDSWEYPSTISPRQLRLNSTPTPNSSSESIHTALLASDNSEFDPSCQRNLFPSKHSSSKGRRQLPTKSTKSNLGHVTSRAADSPAATTDSQKHLPRHEGTHHRPKLAELKPRPKDLAVPGAAPPGMLASQARELSEKDEFLIRSREMGISYREIRERGNFVEAESTLRGRHRNMTKAKEARVRKPQWQENDIYLLKKAVHKLARGKDLTSAKIPWKEVAQYIFDNGGSYLFGNATCRKRWDDLVLQGKAL